MTFRCLRKRLRKILLSNKLNITNFDLRFYGDFLLIKYSKNKMADIIETNHDNQEEFYKSLKEKLESQHNFPEEYLFKFIVPGDSEKITEILRVFDGLKYTLSNRESSKGKYTSVSLQCFVMDADQVIDIYQQVAKIENVMML